MDLEKLINDIEKVLKKALEIVLGSTDKIEKGLLAEIKKLLNNEFSTKGGKILRNAENVKAINKIRKGIEKYINSGLFNDLKVFEPAFKSISELVYDNYSEFATTNAKEIANLIKEQSIELVKEQFVAEGIASEIMPELGTILRSAAIEGQTITQTLAAVEQLVTSGLLPNAAKRITIDGLVTYSRNYINALTKDFNSEWFLYEGPLRSTSRSFCESRAGKYYTKKEVQSWASLDWQGKKPGTTPQTIFTLAGGYNCYHLILPVPEAAVPEKYKGGES